MVSLSDSFRTSVSELISELGAELVGWTPAAGEGLPAGAQVALFMAGGAESAALDQLPASAGRLPCYLVGASPDHRLAAAALQAGAKDYFSLPDDLNLLRRVLERERREARGRVEAARFAAEERQAAGFDSILGRSPALLKTLQQARRVAKHGEVTVLIGGETGTGKELLARALHYESPRATAPFVDINCAAIPANLLESELFGHEKGSFTGAVAAKPGLFEQAHGGTVFLDEIGQLPLELQPKLLRALEGREVRRVGGQQTRKLDVRLIAATHMDLGGAVRSGQFREDLYYRLNVVHLVLPPLRERTEDLELLAEAFASRLARQYGLPTPTLSVEARVAIRSHGWPGNVRELRNAIERALVLSPSGTIDAAELPRPAAVAAPGGNALLPFPATIRQLTQAAAVATLALVSGNKSEAARRLGISRPRLQRILEGGSDEE